MLNDVSINSTSRLREVRAFLAMIQALPLTSSSTLLPALAIGKGLFFVHLYGAYEFTVISAVQKTLSVVSSMKHNVSDYKLPMLSIVLDANCRSVASVGHQRLWESRAQLFNQILPGNIVDIDDTVLPTDGGNLKYRQLESVWTIMCVGEPVLPKPQMRGRLEELVENRNAISHGRESASAIGGRYSVSDLEQRLVDINELCTYIVQCLENYIKNKDFLR